ncbi:MAG: L-2-hydroxyglutarate oxidase [Terriglobales bacterium]
MSGTLHEVAVVGGGIVGLALARELLQRVPGRRVVVLEKESGVGAHQTGHNSGVIHTGVYYRPGSLKAQLCVGGAREMIAYCRSRGLPWRQPGKVIVAAGPGELAGLREIERRGQANGVEGLRWLDGDGLRELEPAIRGVAALQVPTSAITDYAAVARSYAAEIVAAGGEVQTGCRLLATRERGETVALETSGGVIESRWAANCAGLWADQLARMAGAAAEVQGMRVLPFRGEYYALSAEAAARLRGLVYPVPDPRFPFLGVHFTPRVGGGCEAGPSAVLAWKREGYGRSDVALTDMAGMLAYGGFWAMAARYWRKGLAEQYRSLYQPAYCRALRRLMPGLQPQELRPGGSGVRAQLVLANGRLMDDFCVRPRGRWLHVLNVPSPAATASLTIARHLAVQWPPP